ncbi:MAG: hypothetical protein H0A76_05860 [Candidatus Thiodubiliella endoseptemdiera]|uniref:Uncharacterized protein n=1 Tax=Candidatus Thiodubiliella endoseptemdiera TaxID=2738886 RepID=A0A853F0S5_9GAMM|nr:hypothetical protein [Candidatus Thiodubiliella endoseptemdiera]
MTSPTPPKLVKLLPIPLLFDEAVTDSICSDITVAVQKVLLPLLTESESVYTCELTLLQNSKGILSLTVAADAANTSKVNTALKSVKRC